MTCVGSDTESPPPHEDIVSKAKKVTANEVSLFNRMRQPPIPVNDLLLISIRCVGIYYWIIIVTRFIPNDKGMRNHIRWAILPD